MPKSKLATIPAAFDHLMQAHRQNVRPGPRKPACALLLLVALGSLASFSGRADCTCICVDGLNRPLCSRVTDIEPVCPPRVCPELPAAKPLEPYRLPPYDAQACSREYFYNKYAKRYEWRQVCR